MARKSRSKQPEPTDETTAEATHEALPEGPDPEALEAEAGGDESELVQADQVVCLLTSEHRAATPQEQTLQSLIEQLHREYHIPIEEMERDVRISCVGDDGVRKRSRTAQLVVYDPSTPRETRSADDIVRVALVSPPTVKADKKAIALLEEVLGGLADKHDRVYGLWTNGAEMAFRMRTFNRRSGQAEFPPLTDLPALDESLEDLNSAERRPLRIATRDSLLRTFKHCHDYIYGNQSMRHDRAFWQLLYLIFCKIHDEQQSRRNFFVGATEANTEEGRSGIARRIHHLFEEVRDKEFSDIFDGNERLELNDRGLAYVAGELSRYNLLGTDTDAKGLAYEAITSATLKRDRGQFFTPRNVIRMMVEMLDPQPGQRILDPACGSGGFLIVALNHMRRRFLRESGADPDQPVPLELKRIEGQLRQYARTCLFGIDVDSDLRKAARMNMVLNNDGHAHIYCFNSLVWGIPSFYNDSSQKDSSQMMYFGAESGGGHGQFDYVLTNPPFGAKIPVNDQEVLNAFDLGHSWERDRSTGTWRRGILQKRVSPEILFIEACYKFLKPGTGVMAIVVPNGILGNPGREMAAVRWWMMHHMELLASVDLPGEAFLPQVSVQASCIFLRRRDESELRLLDGKEPKQRPVFMAIAEQCGHGRRGEPRYVRRPDGSLDLQVREVVERWEQGGKVRELRRRREVKELADDMPWIAGQYRRIQNGEPLEAR